VTVKLGLFTMPFHHPDRDYGQILAEDQEGEWAGLTIEPRAGLRMHGSHIPREYFRSLEGRGRVSTPSNDVFDLSGAHIP